MIVVVHSTSRRPLKTSLQPHPQPSLQVKAAAFEVSCTREMWGTRKHSPFTARPRALASKEPAEQQCSSSLGGWKWESEKESCILLWVLVLLETQPASVLWLRTSKTMKIVGDRMLQSYGIIGMWWLYMALAMPAAMIWEAIANCRWQNQIGKNGNLKRSHYIYVKNMLTRF